MTKESYTVSVYFMNGEFANVVIEEDDTLFSFKLKISFLLDTDRRVSPSFISLCVDGDVLTIAGRNIFHSFKSAFIQVIFDNSIDYRRFLQAENVKMATITAGIERIVAYNKEKKHLIGVGYFGGQSWKVLDANDSFNVIGEHRFKSSFDESSQSGRFIYSVLDTSLGSYSSKARVKGRINGVITDTTTFTQQSVNHQISLSHSIETSAFSVDEEIVYVLSGESDYQINGFQVSNGVHIGTWVISGTFDPIRSTFVDFNIVRNGTSSSAVIVYGDRIIVYHLSSNVQQQHFFEIEKEVNEIKVSHDGSYIHILFQRYDPFLCRVGIFTLMIFCTQTLTQLAVYDLPDTSSFITPDDRYVVCHKYLKDESSYLEFYGIHEKKILGEIITQVQIGDESSVGPFITATVGDNSTVFFSA